MRIVLQVEYAGDVFYGWQLQAQHISVQGCLESAIEEIAGHKIRLHCAGRTDAGVHACCQIVHFDSQTIRPLTAWVRGVNAVLGRLGYHYLRVVWAKQVNEDFHARYRAYGRYYRYLLHVSETQSAIWFNRVAWTHWHLDEKRMQQAIALLVGKHDFSAFRSAGCQGRTPVKYMYHTQMVRRGNLLILDFYANAFLLHMVRNIVGALVYVGKGDMDLCGFERLFSMTRTENIAPTFSAAGLYFCGVDYPDEWDLPNNGNIRSFPLI